MAYLITAEFSSLNKNPTLRSISKNVNKLFIYPMNEIDAKFTIVIQLYGSPEAQARNDTALKRQPELVQQLQMIDIKSNKLQKAVGENDIQKNLKLDDMANNLRV